MLRPGEIIERYRIDGVLGRGGMAVVYAATHTRFGTAHAIKVVHSPEGRDRLLLEGQIQAGLRHPNLVAVTDVIDGADGPGLVMERVHGPTLAALLRVCRLDLVQADAMARAILAGVAEAHRHGLVHRDLNPNNILLAPTPDGFVPKVTDFGLARRGAAATRSTTFLGTPAYVAPEQLRDARDVDARADVWSLGATLYELVSGRRAFEGDDPLAVIRAIDSRRPVPLRQVCPEAPERMIDAVDAALSAAREERPDDAGALLVRWEAGTPTPQDTWPTELRSLAQELAPAVTLPPPARQRRRGPTRALAGGTAALAAGLWLARPMLWPTAGPGTATGSAAGARPGGPAGAILTLSAQDLVPGTLARLQVGGLAAAAVASIYAGRSATPEHLLGQVEAGPDGLGEFVWPVPNDAPTTPIQLQAVADGRRSPVITASIAPRRIRLDAQSGWVATAGALTPTTADAAELAWVRPDVPSTEACDWSRSSLPPPRAWEHNDAQSMWLGRHLAVSFRLRLPISVYEEVVAARLTAFTDDDQSIWVNGEQVVDDHDRLAGPLVDLDLSGQLRQGDNELLVQSQNTTWKCGFLFVDGEVQVVGNEAKGPAPAWLSDAPGAP